MAKEDAVRVTPPSDWLLPDVRGAVGEDGLDRLLTLLGTLFPDPLFIVDETDAPVWMNLAMADRICRDHALEPEYAVEWLLSQFDDRGDEVMSESGDMAAIGAMVSRRIVGLSDILGRPEWLSMQITDLTSGAGALRLVSLQDVTPFKQTELALRDTNAVISHALNHDGATGLRNRHSLEQVLAEIPAPQRRALILVHFPGLRTCLTAQGAAVADNVLGGHAACLADLVADDVLVARAGFDCLAVVVSPAERQQVQRLAQDLAEGVLAQDHAAFAGAALPVRVAVALDPATGGRDPATSLLAEAEALLALDTAPSDARRFALAVDEGEGARLRQRDAGLLADLRSALAEDCLIPHFQPVIDTRTGYVTHMEAFARWRHPTLGLVPPPLFLRLARQAGLIGAVDMMITQKALRIGAEVRAGGHEIGLALNHDRGLLSTQDGVETLLRAIADARFPAAALTIECPSAPTETGELTALARGVSALKDAGLRVVLDNAGCQLNTLTEVFALSPDGVKLGLQAVTAVSASLDTASVEDVAARALRRTVTCFIANAVSDGLEVAAVGIQSDAARTVLADLGAHVQQGTHFARPMARDAMLDWVQGCRAEDAGERFLAG